MGRPLGLHLCLPSPLIVRPVLCTVSSSGATHTTSTSSPPHLSCRFAEPGQGALTLGDGAGAGEMHGQGREWVMDGPKFVESKI